MDTPAVIPPPNTLATVSAVLGVVSVLGTCCCCVPLISYLAMVLVPMLSLAAIITGIFARQQAQRTGVGMTPAMIGIGGGIGAVVIMVIMFGLGALAGVGFMALSVLGQQ